MGTIALALLASLEVRRKRGVVTTCTASTSEVSDEASVPAEHAHSLSANSLPRALVHLKLLKSGV